MNVLRGCALAVCLSFAAASPAFAGWKLIPGRQAADLTGIVVTPQIDWNQASGRPGKQGRSWTRDGFGLNGLEFFAAVPSGQPLYRERSKKSNPMPKFDKAMLLPDLADFFERSFRVNYQPGEFTVVESGPASLGNHAGLRIRYRYTLANDELVRLGEARLAMAKGRLYVVNYFAPELHYFAAGLAEANGMMDGARF